MKAASHVPSGVFTVTLVSTTSRVAASADTTEAAASPAPIDRTPNARRDTSSFVSFGFLLSSIAGSFQKTAAVPSQRALAARGIITGNSPPWLGELDLYAVGNFHRLAGNRRRQVFPRPDRRDGCICISRVGRGVVHLHIGDGSIFGNDHG